MYPTPFQTKADDHKTFVDPILSPDITSRRVGLVASSLKVAYSDASMQAKEQRRSLRGPQFPFVFHFLAGCHTKLFQLLTIYHLPTKNLNSEEEVVKFIYPPVENFALIRQGAKR